MKTTNCISIDVSDEIGTKKIAKALAEIAEIGDVIALHGTLGVGKTSFARAFIRHCCGDEEDVPSPTFTLVQTYDFINKQNQESCLWHFDLYRIKLSEEVFELGVEDAFTNGISLIEWPEKLGAHLPIKRLDVSIDILEGKKNFKKRKVIINSRHGSWDIRLTEILKNKNFNAVEICQKDKI